MSVRGVSAETSAASVCSDAGSTCSTTWYRSPADPRSRSDDRALSASSPSASACRWPKLVSAASSAQTSVRNRSAAASSARRTTARDDSSAISSPRRSASSRRRSTAARCSSMDAGAVVAAVGAMAEADTVADAGAMADVDTMADVGAMADAGMSMTAAPLPGVAVWGPAAQPPPHPHSMTVRLPGVAVVGSFPERTGRLCSDATLRRPPAETAR